MTVADAQLLQSGGWTPLRFSAYVRRATVQRIFTVLPEEQAAVLVGMLLGEKQYLPEDDANLYRNLGVMHVFAVSGLHVGFVAALVISLLGKVTINTTAGSARVLRFMVTGAVLLFYAALAGFSASVVRAVAMTLVGIFSYVVDRRKDFYNALALAALAWLLYRPLALFDAGFQLSFAAALGIYYLNPAADKLLSFLPDWRSIVTVPLVAQLALLPPLAYHFGTVSLVSLLANIPVVFAAGAIIILGIVIMALQFVFWPVAELLLFSAGMLIEMVQRYLDLLGHIPFAYLYLRMPLPLEIVLYYIILVGLREGIMGNLPMAKDKGRWLKRGLAAALVILIIVGSIPGKKLEVIFLDVGQGDAALVMTPGGKNILIDAAGGFWRI